MNLRPNRVSQYRVVFETLRDSTNEETMEFLSNLNHRFGRRIKEREDA